MENNNNCNSIIIQNLDKCFYIIELYMKSKKNMEENDDQNTNKNNNMNHNNNDAIILKNEEKENNAWSVQKKKKWDIDNHIQRTRKPNRITQHHH